MSQTNNTIVRKGIKSIEPYHFYEDLVTYEIPPFMMLSRNSTSPPDVWDWEVSENNGLTWQTIETARGSLTIPAITEGAYRFRLIKNFECDTTVNLILDGNRGSSDGGSLYLDGFQISNDTGVSGQQSITFDVTKGVRTIEWWIGDFPDPGGRISPIISGTYDCMIGKCNTVYKITDSNNVVTWENLDGSEYNPTGVENIGECKPCECTEQSLAVARTADISVYEFELTTTETFLTIPSRGAHKISILNIGDANLTVHTRNLLGQSSDSFISIIPGESLTYEGFYDHSTNQMIKLNDFELTGDEGAIAHVAVTK